jgi:phage gp29-like protein
MAKKSTTTKQLPEYGELVSIMQSETASILTDYIRQYVGVASQNSEPGSGIFLNWDRVQRTQTYQELAWYDLYAEVEKDPHVSAILQSSKLNVSGMRWDMFAHVEPGEKKATPRNEEIAQFVKHALLKVGYFPQHMFNLMDALGKGFAVSEIIWDITDEGVMVGKILNRPQRRFQFDAVDRSLKLRDISNPYFGVPLPDKKFIVHRCSSTWDNPFGDALDQSLYWMWLFKKTAHKYWMQHLQVAASCIPIVKHPASANKELKAEALEIAKMIRNGAFGRMPENFELIWAEASNAGMSADVYHTFIRMCNDEMSKAVGGQSLTTEASSSTGTGTYSQGKVHLATQNARDIFRADGLASTINATLVKWLVDFNFAGIEGYPQFKFDLEEPDNLLNEATIVSTLANAGFKFDVQELSDKFGYTLTEKEIPKVLAPFAKGGEEETEDETNDVDDKSDLENDK